MRSGAFQHGNLNYILFVVILSEAIEMKEKKKKKRIRELLKSHLS